MNMRGFISALALAIGVVARPHVPRSTVSVDLGYSVYQGNHDSNNSINIFKGYVSNFKFHVDFSI
jgi:hypothetical protein